MRILSGHRAAIHSVPFSPDGRQAASASSDNTVRIWELTGGRESHRLIAHGYACAVAFAPDGRTVATGGTLLRAVPTPDGTNVTSGVVLWNRATGTAIRTLIGHHRAVTALAFSPYGRLLASGSGDGTIRLWAVDRP